MKRMTFLCVLIMLAAAMAVWSALPASAETELSKGPMSVTASGDGYEWFPRYAIDSKTPDPGWYAGIAANAWLRVDLGDRYRVSMFGYQPRVDTSDGRIDEYEIYVSDTFGPAGGSGGLTTAQATALWGDAAATGSWPSQPTRVPDVTFAGKYGRYVILRATSAHGASAGANEVYIYGGAPDTRISEFAVSDQSAGTAYHTDNATVAVSLAAEEGAGPVVGYMIREIPDAPLAGDAGWLSEAPTTYAITGGEGEVALYAWVKDDTDLVAGAQDMIVYSTNVPAISNVAIDVLDYTITVSWETSVDAVGWIQWGAQGGPLDQITEPTAYGIFHILDITVPVDGITYSLEIHSNATTSLQTAEIPLATPTPGNVVWSGAASPELGWSRGANWQGKQQPYNPTAGTVTFTNVGAAAADDFSITNVLDPEAFDPLAEWWTIGALTVGNPPSGALTSFNHTTDLGGKRLITGNVNIAYYGYDGGVADRKTVSAIFTNGTLQIGADGSPKDLIVASGVEWYATAFLTMANDASLEMYLRNVTIGGGNGGMGKLDLRNGQLTGGTLKAANISMSSGGSGGIARSSYSEIMINSACGIQNLEVTGTLTMADGGAFNYARIGDPDNDWLLPADLNITIGVDQGVRGNLIVARQNCWSGAASMVASSGGTFNAYVKDMIVGKNTGGQYGATSMTGTIDLRSMSSCTIDATNVQIGIGKDAVGPTSRGFVYLPAGTAVADTVLLGDSIAQVNPSIGLLQLEGTQFAVNTSLTLKKTGSLITHVKGKSAGVDLAAAAAFVINDGAAMQIIFDQEQDPGESGEYWGLRWEGDHRAVLSGLNNSGKVTWDTSAITGSANVFYDGTCTYVAVKTAWPPSVIARSLTLEVLPPDVTVLVINLADVDASPADPDVISATITCPQDTDSDPATVTLTGLTTEQTFQITLTLTKVGGAEASDVATLNVIIVPEPTIDALTWTGAASTTMMERREWFWGANWLGGLPPDPGTVAAITFADQGIGRNVVTQDRTTGALTYMNSSGTYTTEFDTHLLAVLGTLTVGDVNRVSTVEFTNGTLQIGLPEQPQDIFITSDGTDWSTVTLIDVTLDTNIGTMTLGDSGGIGTRPAAKGVLDLRSATIANGVLKANNIIIGVGTDNLTYPQGNLLVGPDSGLATIEVTGTLGMATGHRTGTCRLGDPDNDYKLPPGVSIKIGVDDATRGNLLVAKVNYDGNIANGLLAASSGGTIDAWLDGLLVGYPGVGTVDLTAMDSCSIVANTIGVGLGLRIPSHLTASGTLLLPPGTVSTGILDVGSEPDGPTTGLLQLNGTACTVATSVTIGPKGTVAVNAPGTACGLDLPDGVTLTIADGGKINIVFAEPAGSGIYYGLRWEGDHTAELQALADADKLTWDDTLLVEPAAIFAQGGFTYVGSSVAMAKVTGFAVTDATSGSALVTNAATVAAAIIAEPAEGQTITGYAVNETGSEPTDGWQASISYDIQAASGDTVTLFAFAIDSAGNIGSTSTDIYFNTAAPAVLSSSVVDNGDGSASVTWITDILAEGSVNYGPVSMIGSTPDNVPENTLGTAHSVTFATAAGVNYKIILVNTEIASGPIYWPKPWPIEGDANQDCRVNILDLIFIRNKLNQPVGTGDNWKADVNEDTRINILDLIFVRNKLNTQCP